MQQYFLTPTAKFSATQLAEVSSSEVILQ